MKFLSNKAGVTLIELLVSLSIFSIISVITISVMINVLNYNTKLSHEIKLRDEADIVMSEFMNYIYTSKGVVAGPTDDLIEVSINESDRILLGFTDTGQAGKSEVYQNGDTLPSQIMPLHNNNYLFKDSSGTKESSIVIEGNTVLIDLYIFDQRESESNGIQLQSRINFVVKTCGDKSSRR